MAETIYDRILKLFPELKTWKLSEDGKEIEFTRKGRPLVLPALVRENNTYFIFLDKTRYIIRHALFIYARKADPETGEMQEKSSIILFSPEDIYFQAIAETKYVTVWKEKIPTKERAKPARDYILRNLRLWLSSAGLQVDKEDTLQSDVGKEPFMDKHGSKLVSVHYRMPGWSKGIKETWPSYGSISEAEKVGNLCPAYFGERDATGRHRMIREPDEKYCRAVLNIPYLDYLAIKRINVIAKNIIHHHHLLQVEEPVVKARYNDIEGVNLITRFVSEKDSEELQYAVWDASIVLTESAAKKFRYRKVARLKIFEPPEPLWRKIKESRKDFLAVPLGREVERFDQVLKQPKLPSMIAARLLSDKNYKKIWVQKYREYEQLVYGEYGVAPISGKIIEYEDFYAIDSGERTVQVGDKILSRTGVKGIIGKIVRDGKLGKINGKNVEMLIGRTKLYSKAALVKELQDSEKLTGLPQIFVFLRDKIGEDMYWFYDEKTPLPDRQVLSDNFREACLASEGLYLYAVQFWQRNGDWQARLNSYLSSVWLQNVRHGLRVKNGEGKRIHDRTLLDLATFIPEKEKFKITKIPLIPPGRIEFIKRPRLNKMIHEMAKTGKLYKSFIEDNKLALYRRNGIIREYILNGRPPIMYNGIVIPIKTEPSRVHLNPEIVSKMHLRTGSIVAVIRHPVIDEYSFGQFYVISDDKVPRSCVALSPSIMPAYSMDCDGDTAMIYPLASRKYADKSFVRFPVIRKRLGLFQYETVVVNKNILVDKPQLTKEGWTLVGSTSEKLIDGKNWKEGIKEWLLEGTWGTVRSKALSQYEDVMKDVEKYKKVHSDKDYINELDRNRAQQYWTVQGVGSMRKKVVAYCQHLPPSIIRGILSIWDVELGMDKFKLFNIKGSPKVVWATLDTIWAYIQGKDKKIFKYLTSEDKKILGENFEILSEGSDWIEIKVDIPKNIDIEKVFGIKDPLILWDVHPSPAGMYIYKITQRESYRLEGLWNMLNIEDFSPYGCLFRNIWHADLFDKHFIRDKAQIAPEMQKSKMEILTGAVEKALLGGEIVADERLDVIPKNESLWKD